MKIAHSQMQQFGDLPAAFQIWGMVAKTGNQ